MRGCGLESWIGIRICGVACAVCALSLPLAAQTSTSDAVSGGQHLSREIRQMIGHARDMVFPALVNIDVITVSYWDGKEHKSQAVGSGTIISDQGYVLTNQHVTNDGEKFTCTLSDKQKIPAKLIGEDALTDLAILQLDLSEYDASQGPLPVARFGDSNTLQIGDYVMAMGSPFSLSRSVTLGIVSNSRRVFSGKVGGDLDAAMQLEAGQRTGLYTQWIQHDALINPGNSGGPLVNLTGRIVGINELGGSSMGFAIPSNLAQRITDELIAHGEVIRSWIGVGLRSIEDTGYDQGVLVDSVAKDGPAGKAGIAAGDVIVSMDGKDVTIRFAEEIPPLADRIAEMKVGTSFPVEYLRDGERKGTTITTEKLQQDLGEQKAFRNWGLTAMGITPHMARQRRLDSTEGVLVTSISDGGPAALAEPPISAGVIIRKVGDKTIRDLKTFIEVYDSILEQDPLPEYLLVEYETQGKNQLTLMKTKPEEETDRPREVAKAWLGVATQPVLKKLADQLGDEKYQGFRITRVYPRTLAAKTDLKAGDIVVGLQGKRIYPRGMHDAGLLSRVIRQMDIGEKITLSVLRDGKMHTIPVELERTRLEPADARREKNRDFEMTVRELTFFDRDEMQWGDDVEGVLIEQVAPAGWAGLGGLASGDLIQRIDDHVIESLEDYRSVMDKITREEPKRVVFVVLRGTRTHYQFVEPEWRPVFDEKNQKHPATATAPADSAKEQN